MLLVNAQVLKDAVCKDIPVAWTLYSSRHVLIVITKESVGYFIPVIFVAKMNYFKPFYYESGKGREEDGQMELFCLLDRSLYKEI